MKSKLTSFAITITKVNNVKIALALKKILIQLIKDFVQKLKVMFLLTPIVIFSSLGINIFMQKSINLGAKKIDYQLKTSHFSKNVRLNIYSDGRFVVVKPRRVSEKLIEKFIIQKANWILEKIKNFGQFKPLVSLEENRGKYLQYKEEARRLIEQKVNHFNKIYNFKFNRITIRNQKTCWGSCSRKGNLNFNYKILFLPEHLANYIVIHELCHLKELNHSRRFWDLLSQSVPNYLEIRRELKKIKN